MALQPNCALWKLHIAGESPGPFVLLTHEVHVQGQKGRMEQCSSTGAVRAARGGWIPPGCLCIPVSDSCIHHQREEILTHLGRACVPHFCTVMCALLVVGYWDHHQLDETYVWSVGLQTSKSKKSVRLSQLQKDEGTVNNFFSKNCWCDDLFMQLSAWE